MTVAGLPARHEPRFQPDVESGRVAGKTLRKNVLLRSEIVRRPDCITDMNSRKAMAVAEG